MFNTYVYTIKVILLCIIIIIEQLDEDSSTSMHV